MMNFKTNQIFSTGDFKNGKTFVLAAAFFLFSLFLSAVQTKADVVTDWNNIADTVAVTNAKRAPAASVVDMAYVHAAVYDAVNAIDGRYSPYAVSLSNVPKTSSQDAAAASAAYHVLKTLFPGQNSFLELKYVQYLENIPDGGAKTKGVEVGREVANRFMALRANDGRDAAVPFSQGSGPGAWQPTPPAYSPAPLTPWMAYMRPFMIESPSQFRAAGLPSLTSDEWARDYNETKNYGALNSSVRSPAQTEIGRFYAEHTGAQYSRILRSFAAGQRLSVADQARLFAMLYLAMADSLIAGWDSKYYFAYWRPVTAIRSGDTDGNELTEADLNWTPLVATPGHPEYPAAHGCLTAAFAEALRAFYGTKKVRVTLSSTVTNTTRTFDNTDDLVKEIIDARIFGGMHYRTSGVHGTVIGKKVARLMNRRYFQPLQ
ncbi:MAG TPA: vanadium-dependent haloperoxidase [Pyrinomonadaceae bacterium]